MMEPEARIAALKIVVVTAHAIVGEAFGAAHLWAGDTDGPLFVAAYGHVLTALIQDIDDGEASR